MKINSKIFLVLLTFFVTITSSAQCNEPTGITVDDINAISATLNWTASTSAPGIGYDFEVRTSGAPGSGVAGLIDSGSSIDGVLTSQISGLLSDTTYLVYMRYQCSDNPNVFSSWTTAIVFSTTPLAAPVAGVPAGLSDTFFTARWIAVPGATGYRLDVSTESDFSVLLPAYSNFFLTSGQTSKLISNLNPSTDYYYRVRAEGNSGSGPVTSDNSNVVMVTTLAEPSAVAVWSEGAWLNDIFPTDERDVFLDDDFISDENNEYMFEVKSLTLNAGYTYTIMPDYFLFVVENVINNSSAGSFVVENNASLYFADDSAPANEGEITVKRNSSEIFRLDYTMWSSPVNGLQTLKSFSPQTADSRFYNYNTANNNFSVQDPITTTFEPGQGYLIRAPNNFIGNNGTNLPQSWTGSFVGVPVNGEISVALSTADQGFNMVGNPYPTVISADEFLRENLSTVDGTIYFWRRLNNSSGAGDLGSFYASYTEFGGVGSDTSDDPNGFIQVGQGFLVKALSSALVFNVNMRVPDNFDNQFFRTSNENEIEKHRIWLNLTNENGVSSKMLVGYAEGASNAIDRLDGSYINDSGVALTSLINNKEYVIQAKALPFAIEDIIPLGFKVVTAGEYTISLNKMDGLFEAGQLVYLEDTFTSTIHNLTDSGYTFSAEAGAFHDRFMLRFTDEVMSVEQLVNQNAIAVIVNDNTIHINSGNFEMKSINIFDVQGRNLFTIDNINDSEISIDSLNKGNQVMLLQITDQFSNTTVKKLIF